MNGSIWSRHLVNVNKMRWRIQILSCDLAFDLLHPNQCHAMHGASRSSYMHQIW